MNSATPIPPPAPEGEGWILHDGGWPSLPLGCEVEVQHASGSTSSDPAYAYGEMWLRWPDAADRIIRYRVLNDGRP
jgi:hypothetical protein